MLTKVDDCQHMSVDDLCFSVQSISLTDVSADKVLEQIVKDRKNAAAKHHVVDSADDDASRISQQLPQPDGEIDVVVISANNKTAKPPVSCLEKADKEEVEKEWKIINYGSSATNAEGKDKLVGVGIGSTNQGADESRSPGMRRCIPQEHDETTDELTTYLLETNGAINELCSRGPPDGIPCYNAPVIGQSSCAIPPVQVFFQHGSENPPKFRKPGPEYIPPSNQPNFTLSSLMNGGNVCVNNAAFEFGGDVVQFRGGLEPLPHEPMIKSQEIDFPDNEMNNIISEFLQTPVNHSIMSSGDYEGIMISANDDNTSDNPPMPTIVPCPDSYTGISTHPGNGFLGFPAVVSPARSSVSPADYYSDCVSPGSALSPENYRQSHAAMSPVSTCTKDSGLDMEDLDIPDYINEFIEEEMKKKHDHTQRAFLQSDANNIICPSPPRQSRSYSNFLPLCVEQQHPAGHSSTGNPSGTNPRVRNPSAGNLYVQNPLVQNTSDLVISTVDQLIPPNLPLTNCGPGTPIQVPVTQIQGPPVTCCYLVPVATVPSQPAQAIATSRKEREILPRPPHYPAVDTNSGLFIFSCNKSQNDDPQPC